MLSINTLHRSQWLGVNGAPRTQTVTVHGPLGERTGIGLSVLNDEIGPVNEVVFAVGFSYQFTV